MRAWALVLVLAAGLAGCSAQAPTSPRPRDVRLDGVDPCSLLTPAQRTQLGLDRPPQFLAGDAEGDRAHCSWRGEQPRAVDTGVTFHTRGGIEIFDTASGRTAASRVAIRDFPALLLRLNGRPEYCAVAVDVAPGQSLSITFSDYGFNPPIPQERLCADAQQVAGMELGNLLAQR